MPSSNPNCYLSLAKCCPRNLNRTFYHLNIIWPPLAFVFNVLYRSRKWRAGQIGNDQQAMACRLLIYISGVWLGKLVAQQDVVGLQFASSFSLAVRVRIQETSSLSSYQCDVYPVYRWLAVFGGISVVWLVMWSFPNHCASGLATNIPLRMAKWLCSYCSPCVFFP